MHPHRISSLVLWQLRVQSRTSTRWHRYISTSSQKNAVVGPPDPVSNMRPVIYDDAECVQSRRRRKGKEKEGNAEVEVDASGSLSGASLIEHTRTSPTHPYQLDEFNGDPHDYQWRLERGRLDAFNHAFWKDSNTRFENAKQEVLASLPESASPEAREAALSEFYGKWLQQEHDRLREYSNEWNRRNFGGILLAARAAISQFRARVFGSPKSR